MASAAATTPVLIGGTAIRFSDLGTIALPLPASHDDIRELVEQVHGRRAGKHHGEIGYVTQHGRFVKPREALLIARQAQQLCTTKLWNEELQFEDLILPARRKAVRGGHLTLVPKTTAPSTPRSSPAPISLPEQPAFGNSLVSRDQLRREFLFKAKIAVPLSMAAGAVSFYLTHGIIGPAWSAALGIEGLGWTALLAQLAVFALAGIGFALVLHARGSAFRRSAILSFAALLGLGCLWAGAVNAGLAAPAALLLASMFPVALMTTSLFARIRPLAGWLVMLYMPCLALWAYSAALSARAAGL